MSLRTLAVVTLAATGLAACGKETTRPSSLDASPGPASTMSESTTPATSVGGSSLTEPTEPTEPTDVDQGDEPAPERLARCDDVIPVGTDVLSDTTQGDIDPVFHGVLLTYAAEHADTFGGLWLDRDAFGTIVMAFTDDPAQHLAALSERRPTPDDVHAADPPPEITDDRPIGEWGVAFDVVRVAHTETDLIDAVDRVVEAAQVVTAMPVSGGTDPVRNRVFIDLTTPITSDGLAALTEAIDHIDGLTPEMVCWRGAFVEEAPPPIEPGTPLDVIRLPDAEGTYPPDSPVSCSGVQFALGDLQNLTPPERVDPGLRAVLDDWLAGAEGRHWPQGGWALLYENDERAAFIHLSIEGASFVGAEMGTNGWIWASASGTALCDLRLLLPPGIGEVGWVLDPTAPALDASSTEIRVLATELACAGGQEMGDRLLGPQVVETDDAVWIVFGVMQQPGPQTCQGNPSTPVVVELDAPLGGREVRDGLVIGPITALLDDR